MSWDLVSALSDYVIYVVGLLVAWAAHVERRFRNMQQRGRDRDRHLTGDEDDPNAPGLLEAVHNLERDVERIDAKLEQAREDQRREHEHVIERLDELSSQIDGD